METLFNCSLWGDEAFSAFASQKSFLSMLQVVIKDTSPPLFYTISWGWFKIFGHSEISIRTLSFLFYLGTAALIYLLAKKLFGKKAGFFAAALTFFNPFLFPFAFEGRMYFCLLFFVILSFYFLVKKNKWGYLLAATAALYSHHFAFFALAAQFLWQLTTIKKFKIKFLLKHFQSYFLIALFYLPWMYPFYLQTSLVGGGFWLGKPKPIDLVNIFINFSQGKIIYSLQKQIPLLLGLILVLRKWSKKYRSVDLLLIFWLVVPPLATFAISQTKLSIFYERYLLYCVPALMILLASRTRKFSLALNILILAVFLVLSFHTFTHPFKKPFRPFASWIKANVSSDIFLINYNGKAHHLWESKYYDLEAPIYSPGGTLPFYVGTAQMTENDVIYKLPDKETIGVITSDPIESLYIENYKIDSYYQEGSLSFVSFGKQQKPQ